MDRLLEANKVASLMRRRENARAIPAARLALDSTILPRTAPDLPLPVRPPNIRLLGPRPAALETTRIAPNSVEFLPPRQTSAQVRSIVRTLEPVVSFPQRPVRPVVPLDTRLSPARIAPAGAVIPLPGGSLAAGRRRNAAEIRLSLRRTRIGGNGIQAPHHSKLRNCQEPQLPKRLHSFADRGRDLRVSGGIGFRLPAGRLHKVKFSAPRTTPLTRSTRLHGMTVASPPRKSAGASPSEVRLTVRGLFGPVPPPPHNVIEFHWPQAMAGERLPRQAAAATRACDVEWIVPPPCAPQLAYSNGVVRLRPKVAPFPTLSVPQPRGIPSVSRLTLVNFDPPQTPFECSSALHGSLVSDMYFGAAPVRKVEPAPAILEEHFEAGLHNWKGGIADWKVDVAGVRAGSLALYTPSLEIPDYLLEFLTRIESGGVTWVFRAANFTDYYKVTLAVAPGGGYEFRRSAVIGGSAETPVVSPVPAGKTAVVLRTRVSGNEFTVSVDGRAVDAWTDSRLTAGGIGFVGAPEDRARLYWVKVTPTGHLSKE